PVSLGPARRDYLLIGRRRFRKLIIRLVFDERLEEMYPHRKGGDRTGLFVPKTLLQPGITNPDSGRVARRVANEPRIGKIVDGPCLAANHPPGQLLIPHHGSRRAARYHAPHHLLHLSSNIGGDHLKGFGFPSPPDLSVGVGNLPYQMRLYPHSSIGEG